MHFCWPFYAHNLVSKAGLVLWTPPYISAFWRSFWHHLPSFFLEKMFHKKMKYLSHVCYHKPRPTHFLISRFIAPIWNERFHAARAYLVNQEVQWWVDPPNFMKAWNSIKVTSHATHVPLLMSAEPLMPKATAALGPWVGARPLAPREVPVLEALHAARPPQKHKLLGRMSNPTAREGQFIHDSAKFGCQLAGWCITQIERTQAIQLILWPSQPNESTGVHP